jgi:hypothetical protein
MPSQCLPLNRGASTSDFATGSDARREIGRNATGTCRSPSRRGRGNFGFKVRQDQPDENLWLHRIDTNARMLLRKRGKERPRPTLGRLCSGG